MKSFEFSAEIFTTNLLNSSAILPVYNIYTDNKCGDDIFISSLSIDNSVNSNVSNKPEKFNIEFDEDEFDCELTDDFSGISETNYNYKVLFSFEVDFNNLEPYNPPINIEDYALDDDENDDE